MQGYLARFAWWQQTKAAKETNKYVRKKLEGKIVLLQDMEIWVVFFFPRENIKWNTKLDRVWYEKLTNILICESRTFAFLFLHIWMVKPACWISYSTFPVAFFTNIQHWKQHKFAPSHNVHN